MREPLNDIERRVLGVLLEKSLAQPQYYPMTLNAIVSACNQKSNRDPVMNLDEEAIWATLEALRTRAYVSRLHPGAAGRVERFRHEVKEKFGWEKPQRAVMAELLLRGPQTIGELRGHCSRMYPFENLESVTAVLDNLSEADPPWVAALPREPGRSAVRYAHRLYTEDEWAKMAGSTAAGPIGPTVDTPGPTPGAELGNVPLGAESGPAGPAMGAGGPGTAVPGSVSGAALTGGAGEVDALRREVGALRSESEGLHSEIADLHETIAELREMTTELRGTVGELRESSDSLRRRLERLEGGA